MSDKPFVSIEIEIVEDEKYYRVYLKVGTHKLHSEKLNLETASDLSHQLKNALETKKKT